MTSVNGSVYYLLKVDYGSKLHHCILQRDLYANGKIRYPWTTEISPLSPRTSIFLKGSSISD